MNTKDRIDYLIALIAEFAKAHGLTNQQAFRYLNSFKGLDFVESLRTPKTMSKETYMMESLTRELILRHMEEKNVTMRQAMEEIYNSKTYASLNNPATGLYFQSPVYLYDMFCNETMY